MTSRPETPWWKIALEGLDMGNNSAVPELVEIDAGSPPGGTPVFREVSDDITTEHAIPSDAMELGIHLALQAMEEELSARWYQETAIASLIDAVRKRVSG